jgi:hypothetical protein
VIGELLEFAANAPNVWPTDLSDSLSGEDSELGEVLRKLDPPGMGSAEDFLEHIEENLRVGRIRLILFTEESPMELRRSVEFLNRQMENSEILLIEATQYKRNGFRIVVPSVVGYVDRARRPRRTLAQEASSNGQRWDEESYFAEAEKQLNSEQLRAVRSVHQAVERLPFELEWASNSQDPAFEVLLPKISSKSLVDVTAEGDLKLNFGSLTGSHKAQSFQEKYRSIAHTRLGRAFDRDHASHTLEAKEWTPKINAVLHILDDLVTSVV